MGFAHKYLTEFFYIIAIILGMLAAPPVNGQGQSAPSAQQPPSPGTNPNSKQQFLPQNLPNKNAPALPLKLFVLGKEAFCNRLIQAFTSLGNQAGFNPSQTTQIAHGAMAKVIQEFRNGRASDYLSSQALFSESNLPMEKNIPGYIATAQFLGRAIGTSENVSLALSASELRFIPHVQKNTDIIVIAKHAAALTVERVNKIIELARQQNIKVHVLWVGESNENSQEIEEARVLAWIVSATGGRFTNLGGHDWPCSNLM